MTCAFLKSHHRYAVWDDVEKKLEEDDGRQRRIVKRMDDVFGKLQCLLVQEDEVGRQGGVVNS